MDAVCINIGIVLAFLLRFGGRLPAFNFQAYTNLAVFITLIQLAALYIYDLYEVEEIRGPWDIFFALFKAVSLGALLIVALSFFTRFLSFPRTVFALSWLLVLVLLSAWRMLASEVLRIKWPVQRVLVVGTGEAAQEILRELRRRSEWGYQVVGVLSRNPSRVGRRIEEAEVIGTISEIVTLVRHRHIDRVIVASPIRHRELIEDLAKSDKARVKVEVIPDLYEIFVGRVDHTLISDIPLVELTKGPVPGWVYLTKRVLDVLGASIALAVSFPIMLLAAILIKLISPGPVFFRQERVGRNERLFKVYKFRTMVMGAEEESGPVLATESDERITPVGKFLRRYRIDELPQLFNILKGDMSFVGPRPERPFFVEKYKENIPGYAERFKIKPGVTGLAQVSGTYATTARNKLKYDLIYIYHQSLFLDLKILLKTLKVVLTGRGAR